MITSDLEYQKAQEEVDHLDAWLAKLNKAESASEKGLTKAGIRKLLSKLHEELGVYEAHLELLASDKQ